MMKDGFTVLKMEAANPERGDIGVDRLRAAHEARSCASADTAERVRSSARRIGLSIGTPATPGYDDAYSVQSSATLLLPKYGRIARDGEATSGTVVRGSYDSSIRDVDGVGLATRIRRLPVGIDSHSLSWSGLSALPLGRTGRHLAGHKFVGHAEQVAQHVGIDASQPN
jgi:hypothetical protein